MDPDPSFFVIDPQDANKIIILKKSFSAYWVLLKGTFTTFVKDKKSKRSHKTVDSRFFLLFFFHLMIEGSGSGAGSRFILMTNGSGSGSRRPKNM
jgi:hypothetical protein